MKTIIIHHVQAMWNSGLEGFGTSFDEVLEKVYEHLSENYYDRVIVTNFEAGFDLDDEQIMLSEFCPVVHDYGYGWEKEMIDPDVQDWTDGGNHSEIVLIDDWMKELPKEVDLCGAFDGECIEDMEIALESLDISVNRLENLIV